MYNNIVRKNPEQEGVLRHSKAFLLFTIQSHLFNSRQIARQISSGLIILKLYFGKKNICEKWKFCIFRFMGSKNWFMIHESWTLNSNSEAQLLLCTSMSSIPCCTHSSFALQSSGIPNHMAWTTNSGYT